MPKKYQVTVREDEEKDIHKKQVEIIENLPLPPNIKDLIIRKLIMGASMIFSDPISFKNLMLQIEFQLDTKNMTSENSAALIEAASAPLISSYYGFWLIFTMSVLFGMNMKIPKLIIEAGLNDENNQDSTLEKLKVAKYLHAAWFYSIPATAVVVLALVFSKEILLLLNQNPDEAEEVQTALRILAISVPPAFLTQAATQVIASFRYQKALIFLGLNLGLWLLAASLAARGIGLPQLGDQGVTIAYCIEAYIACFISYGFLIFAAPFKQYPFFSSIPNFFTDLYPTFMKMFKNGLAITVSVLFEMSLIFGLVACAGLQSIESQRLFGIALQVFYFNNPTGIHFSLASMIMLSGEIKRYKIFLKDHHHELPENQLSTLKKDIKRVAYSGAAVVAGTSVLLPLVFAIYPKLAAIIMNEKVDQRDLTYSSLIWMICLVSFLDNFRLLFLIELRSVKDLKVSTALTAISELVGLLIAFAATWYSDDVRVVMLGYLAASILNNVLLAPRWHTKMSTALEEPIQRENSTLTACLNRIGIFNSCRRNRDDLNSELEEFNSPEPRLTT